MENPQPCSNEACINLVKEALSDLQGGRVSQAKVTLLDLLNHLKGKKPLP